MTDVRALSTVVVALPRFGSWVYWLSNRGVLFGAARRASFVLRWRGR